MDAGILEQVLYHIHNWFEHGEHSGRFQIEDGSLPASISSQLLEGQYYRIEESVLNDGLHQHPADDLSDEEFEGKITGLAVPKALIAVAEDIAAWQDANGDALDSPYASESFGGYSYTLKGGIASQNGSHGLTTQGLTGWRAAFADRLNPWRKIA